MVCKNLIFCMRDLFTIVVNILIRLASLHGHGTCPFSAWLHVSFHLHGEDAQNPASASLQETINDNLKLKRFCVWVTGTC